MKRKDKICKYCRHFIPEESDLEAECTVDEDPESEEFCESFEKGRYDKIINQWLICVALLLIIVFVVFSTITVGKVYYKLQDLDGPLKKATESVEIVHKKLVEIDNGNKNKNILQAFKDMVTKSRRRRSEPDRVQNHTN
jgi:hypothetical protein